MYIFDLTKDPHHSKQGIRSLNELLREECNDSIVKILVGNKSDLANDRKIGKTVAKRLAEKNGFDRYVETSA